MKIIPVNAYATRAYTALKKAYNKAGQVWTRFNQGIANTFGTAPLGIPLPADGPPIGFNAIPDHIMAMSKDDDRTGLLSLSRLSPTRIEVGANVEGEKGSYLVTKALASEGAMSTVFEVQDTQGNTYILKSYRGFDDLSPREQVKAGLRFAYEAQTTEYVQGIEHVVELVDVEKAALPTFIIMHRAPGKSLSEWFMEDNDYEPLDVKKACEIILQVLDGLIKFKKKFISAEREDKRKSLSIAHRDIKPGNIIIREDEEGKLKAVLIDFGIAKRPDSTLTEVADIMGTPGYAAPETISRGAKIANQSSDIFSLGAVLFLLLTAKELFTDLFEDAEDDKAVVLRYLAICNNERKLMSYIWKRYLEDKPDDCPQEIWDILFTAVNTKAEERYEIYEQLQYNLKLALEQLP